MFFSFSFFFFNATATTEIYTLSLHDALPIYPKYTHQAPFVNPPIFPLSARYHTKNLRCGAREAENAPRDRKSTRLNSSHVRISYAVFCLKKKKKNKQNNT